MAINHKLTNVIQGRRITGTSYDNGKLAVQFDDGSVMTVKSAAGAVPAPVDGAVKTVWQRGTTLTIELEDGTQWEVEMEEETSSVMLRDKDKKFEYAD